MAMVIASSVVASLRGIWKDQRLWVATEICVYQSLMLSALLRAGETWKLLATNVKQLKAFYVKCQRQIIRIRWSEHVSNAVMLSCTRLTDNQLNDILAKRRNAVFGDVA